MATRTRSRTGPGKWLQKSYTMRYRFIDLATGVAGGWITGSSQVLTHYSEGMVSESMTDVIGSFGAEHPCAHSCVTVLGGPVEKKLEFSVISGANRIEYEVTLLVTPSEYLMGVSAHASTPAGLDALARARIPATCREDLSGLINLAEMRETVNSGAVRLLKGLSRLGLAAYRGKPTKKARREFKKLLMGESSFKGYTQHLIGANLEWKFGWAPFIRDLTAAVHVVDRAAKVRAKLAKGYRVYGTATHQSNTSATDVPVVLSSYKINYLSYSYRKTTNIRATASIMRRIKTEQLGPDWQLMLPIFTEMMGLRPSLSKAWDLIPMSFVVDWIYPIGDMIESMEGMTTPQSNWIESYDSVQSLTRHTVVEGSSKATLVDSRANGKNASSGAAVTRSDYSRTVGALTGTSPVYIPPIQWRDLSPGKWFTGMELLLQRMLR